jgi:hypothetical protein
MIFHGVIKWEKIFIILPYVVNLDFPYSILKLTVKMILDNTQLLIRFFVILSKIKLCAEFHGIL